jgi:hypothetical protein
VPLRIDLLHAQFPRTRLSPAPSCFHGSFSPEQNRCNTTQLVVLGLGGSVIASPEAPCFQPLAFGFKSAFTEAVEGGTVGRNFLNFLEDRVCQFDFAATRLQLVGSQCKLVLPIHLLPLVCHMKASAHHVAPPEKYSDPK